jgi:histidyl-tRNA synthetase
LRLLDCKNPSCSALADHAPSILDYLGEESKQHFEQVKSSLTQLGISFEVSNRLVRGLDYYTRTVFEFVAESGLGAQNTVAAGGRYDNLVAELGGPSTPAFGFAAGIERLILLLEDNGFKLPEARPDFSLVYADDAGKAKVFELAQAWRLKGFWVDFEHKAKSVKAQMRRADRMRSKEVIVIGAREVESGEAQAKNLDSGETRVCGIS